MSGWVKAGSLIKHDNIAFKQRDSTQYHDKAVLWKKWSWRNTNSFSWVFISIGHLVLYDALLLYNIRLSEEEYYIKFIYTMHVCRMETAI